jgi:hypothetical protein
MANAGRADYVENVGRRTERVVLAENINTG